MTQQIQPYKLVHKRRQELPDTIQNRNSLIVGRQKDVYQRPHSFHPMDKANASIQGHAFAKRALWGLENKENISANLNSLKGLPDKPATKLWEVNWTYLVPECHKENGVVPVVQQSSKFL